MPNWCSNDIRIEGPTEDVERFFDRVYDPSSRNPGEAEGPSILATYLPTPPELLGSGGEGWYNWRLDEWGTKWPDTLPPRDLLEVYGLGDDETEVFFTTDTAWSPPTVGFTQIALLFPTLTFEIRYFESGVGFHGRFRVRGEEVLDDESGPYYGDRGG